MTKNIEKSIEQLKLKISKTDAEVEAFEKLGERILNAIEAESVRPVQLSWLPTETARSSIFSPIADQDLKERFTEITFKSSWGSVKVTGPPLNTTDESVFLALLFLVRKHRKATIQVNYKALCELLGLTYQTRNRRRLKAAIKKLAHVSLDFELKDGTWAIERILKSAKGDGDLSVIEVDPWFYSKFLHNEITMLDLKFRQGLRGDVTKSLYRFLSSHRGSQHYRTETLVLALNMNQRQPLRKNRDTLKRAFGQLRSKGFLQFQYKADTFLDIKLS